MTALKKLYCFETFPNSTCQKSLGKKITYTYDSMNRRVARTDENGTTQYLYGNPNHPFQLTAVRSPSGSLSRYHYDDFGLLFALERDNNWYYITTDQLGTPRVVCDANGELVKVLEYDSFGQVMADSYPEFELHISFAGGLIDVETELVRFGFRDYDAVAGKWTAKDPIGFAGGDENLYAYISNNPMNWFDPMGLEPKIVTYIGDEKTCFDSRIKNKNGELIEGDIFCITTKVNVSKKALPGAANPYKSTVVGVRYNEVSLSYGPAGAYIDTGDPRGRHIHGGGNCGHIKDKYAPQQGWCPTYGCTRGQNQDVIDLGKRIEMFQKKHPGIKIPYERVL